MDTEPYPVVAGLLRRKALIRKAVIWKILYPEYEMAMNTKAVMW